MWNQQNPLFRPEASFPPIIEPRRAMLEDQRGLFRTEKKT